MLGRPAQGPKLADSASPDFPSENSAKCFESGQLLGVHAHGPDWPGKRNKNVKNTYQNCNKNV